MKQLPNTATYNLCAAQAALERAHWLIAAAIVALGPHRTAANDALSINTTIASLSQQLQALTPQKTKS